MKELFALTILRIINLGFASQIGRNPTFIDLVNKQGQTIYVSNNGDFIRVSGYKVSSRCINIDINDSSEIEEMVTKIKEKLKTDDNEI